MENFYLKSASGQIYLVNKFPKFSAGYSLATDKEVEEYEKKFGEIPALNF